MSRFQTIRGIPFPNIPWYNKENIEKTMDYIPKEGDIIISSYPKTGTSWLQYIVLQIISKGKLFPPYNDCLYKITPLMEITGPEVIDSLKGLRIYKHHYRYNMVQKNPKSKVLYIYRNPEDTLISSYHYMRDVLEGELDLNEFFEGFLKGEIDYGRYFEHVLSYLSHKGDDNLLLISYEKLHANPKEGILKIAKFLGEEYYQNLSSDELLLNKILEQTSFYYMKKQLLVTVPRNEPETDSANESENVIDFFRRGIVGDGKRWLSSHQLRRLRKEVAETMKGTEVLEEWISV